MKDSLRTGVSRTNRVQVDRDRTIGFMGEDDGDKTSYKEMKTKMLKATAMRNPGTNPARNCFPTEVFIATQISTSGALGGMRTPKEPAEGRVIRFSLQSEGADIFVPLNVEELLKGTSHRSGRESVTVGSVRPATLAEPTAVRAGR